MKIFRTAVSLLCLASLCVHFLPASASPQSAPSPAAPAPQPPSPEPNIAAQLTSLLRDFLAVVPRSDPRVFDNFFADDVIYTRSAGVTVNKAEIMKNIGVRAANEPAAAYDADDITVHPYGEMAILNFRLIQHTEKDGKTETAYFRNTATFLKRSARWQVIAWQATRVPSEAAPKP